MGKDVDYLENSGHFEYMQSTRKPCLFCQRTKAIHLKYEWYSGFHSVVLCCEWWIWKPFWDVGFQVSRRLWLGLVALFQLKSKRDSILVGWRYLAIYLNRIVANYTTSWQVQSQKWPFAAEEDKTTLCSIPGSTVTTCVYVSMKASMPNFGHRESVNCFLFRCFFQVSLVDEQGPGKARPRNHDNFYTENLFAFSHWFFCSRCRDVN